ncbi:MAG TPA: DUF4389 domain-containing protein [Dehalococcoidia bacterium]|jgi:hypothetical protein|nr:DUF4389 domain-containing protein [Dehalococcoidia bacterium]
MAVVAPYPVTYEISRPERYNRWTVAFRLILAIPQIILVGGSSYNLFNPFTYLSRRGSSLFFPLFSGGLLSAVLGILVFFAWFAIMFTGRFPGFRSFCLMIYRWQQNVAAYMALQAAPYPPFGEGPYPLQIEVVPTEDHKRLTIFFRLFMVIPHLIVLWFLGFAQGVVSVIAWFAILFTGQFPEGLFGFSVGVSRWAARVSAYALLFVDEYPPFSLDPQPA